MLPQQRALKPYADRDVHSGVDVISSREHILTPFPVERFPRSILVLLNKKSMQSGGAGHNLSADEQWQLRNRVPRLLQGELGIVSGRAEVVTL